MTGPPARQAPVDGPKYDPLEERLARSGTERVTLNFDEIALGSWWLRRFLELMQPRCVAAVRQTAARVVPGGAVVLRRLAHGGSRQLQTDLMALAADLRAERGD